MEGSFVKHYISGRFFFILALALDRVTKYWALSRFGPYQEELAFLSLGLHFNRGISFSLLEDCPYLTLTVALTAVFFGGLLCVSGRRVRAMPGMAFLWAGAAGNLADRLLYGYVIDWIYIFRIYINLADIWLCVGGLTILVYCVKSYSSVGQTH